MDKKRTAPTQAAANERRVWSKPTLRVHGNLAALTRAKNPNGVDSGLGTEVS